MAFKTISSLFLIQTFLCSLLNVFLTGHGVESDRDILCLRSIKDSLKDPQGYLSSSWNFNNKTKGSVCRFIGVECWNSTDSNRVLTLHLSNLGLTGQFPRAIQNCSSLQGLDLSNNQFFGPLPSDISALFPYAVSIVLSNNEFSGEIPADFSNLTYLNTLKLDNNMLQGQIPQGLGLLRRLISFDVSNNQLSGVVPVFKSDGISVHSYDNNIGLCGGPLEPCTSTSDAFHESFRNGLIVGYALSVTSVIVVYLSYFAPWPNLKRKKKNHRNKAKEPRLHKYMIFITSRKTRMAAYLHRLVAQQFPKKGSKEISVVLESLKSTIRFEEINDATNCFNLDNAIGVGKMGIMYEGRLPNGQHVAVKRLFDTHLYNRQFLSETMILGKYKHRNIMPLLGFCKERIEKILVYPCMSNGRLSKWLHPLKSEAMILKWPELVNIALGLARGLSWLHHSCDLGIVHLNICSECILLDENYESKISNFGEAKFMNPNIDGDLRPMFKVDDGKKDVYDFGSVLFELITGKTYNELSSSSSTDNLCGNPSNFCDAVSKSLLGKGFENELFTLVKIACECVQPLPDQRPTMLQIYKNMMDIWEEQRGFCVDSDTSRQSEIVLATCIDEIVEL